MNKNPSEFLTLPAGRENNYIEKGKGDNINKWVKWGKPCRGEFSKIRIILKDPPCLGCVRVDRKDVTFMTTDSKCSPLKREDGRPTDNSGFGGASGCYWRHHATGKFNIDLSDTMWRIPESVSWKAKGYMPAMKNFKMSADRQRVSAICGGHCGGCTPSSGEQYLPLEFAVLKGNCLVSAPVLCLTADLR